MFLYRIKQFYWALNPKLNIKDIEYLNKNLNKEELKLFYSLSKNEQKHSINVAYDVENVCKTQNLNKQLLLKASLLHDIGKIKKSLTVIDKSIIVIMDFLSHGYIKRFSNITKVNIYYNHAEIGYKILKKYEYEQKLLYLIKNHHNDKIKEDKELDILRMCDNRN